MFDLDLWREIFQSMNKNRTRTLLSGFTVAFAILLFTILIGIANGLGNTFQQGFADDAINAIFVRTGRTTKAYDGLQAGRRIQLKNEDFDYINEEFKDKIQYSTVRIFKSVNASYKGEKNNYSVRAVNPDHQFLEKTLIKDGRYISLLDLNNKSKSIVIGRLVEEDLFSKESALGEFINLSGINYKVVGVFTDEGNDNEERVIYMPATTAQLLYGNNDYVDEITLGYNPNLSVDEAIAFSNKLTKRLKDRFSVAPTDQSAVRVFNMASQNKAVSQFQFALGLIIIVIGLGTLIAGIVGISNIMIFIVKERTKEIGIRKALGAPPRKIVSLILLESIIITAIAGYLGLVLGVAILEWANPLLEDYFIKEAGVSTNIVVTATIILVLAGSLAGYLPAKKASKIKPIVALRND
ncbi:ABC transporter permease [Flavobacteriaceae bacterium S0862]|nr:ABC transporter permease [Flavobacteriaceae bacterium S0862]